MLEINKNYLLDSNQQPIAVQIPIAEFEKIEEILEDYGLAKLMDETKDDETLDKEEALKYLAFLKADDVLKDTAPHMEGWIHKAIFEGISFFTQRYTISCWIDCFQWIGIRKSFWIGIPKENERL